MFLNTEKSGSELSKIPEIVEHPLENENIERTLGGEQLVREASQATPGGDIEQHAIHMPSVETPSQIMESPGAVVEEVRDRGPAEVLEHLLEGRTPGGEHDTMEKILGVSQS